MLVSSVQLALPSMQASNQSSELPQAVARLFHTVRLPNTIFSKRRQMPRRRAGQRILACLNKNEKTGSSPKILSKGTTAYYFIFFAFWTSCGVQAPWHLTRHVDNPRLAAISNGQYLPARVLHYLPFSFHSGETGGQRKT